MLSKILIAYRYFTKTDLTSWGKYLFMGLIGIIIALVVNMFLHNLSVDWLVSYIGVGIFVGLTAYDTQRIRWLGEIRGAADSEQFSKVAVDTGPADDPKPEVVLASVIVAGERVANECAIARLTRPAVKLDDVVPTIEAVEALPVTRKRTITFSETSDGKTFFIDGREFDTNRDDITVTVGDVEEWTLVNTTGERHVFHIHQIDFLVESINDNDPEAEGLRDTIDIPYARKGVPGKVVIKMPFINPDIDGRFPYHCHILEHEDNGMMATLRVLPAGSRRAPAR
jgi:FtsP/CotA-like multicopper oxidase with cupredoxin domain